MKYKIVLFISKNKFNKYITQSFINLKLDHWDLNVYAKKWAQKNNCFNDVDILFFYSIKDYYDLVGLYVQE